MNRKQRTAVYIVIPALMFAVTYYIYYPQTATATTDIYAHMNQALSLSLALRMAHCGWHLVCWLFYACLPITIGQGAAAATAAFNALTAVIVLWMTERFFDEKGNTAGSLLTSAVTMTALMVGPLYLRFYNPRYYLGQGTPNIWHNPTSVAARTTMLLVGVLTVDYWNCDPEKRVGAGPDRRLFKRGIRLTTAYQLAMGTLLLLSTLAKPSYLMAYAPAVFLFLVARLIKGRGRNFFALIVENLYFLPSLLLFFSQYIRIYIFGGVRNKTGGVTISWFTVAGKYAPNIGISLVLRMAFPLLVILLWWKYIYKDQLFRLLFLQYVIAVVISWAFAETGARANAGNFGWGNMMCSSFLWIWSVQLFAREWQAEGWDLRGKPLGTKLRYGIPLILLIWHLLAGIISLPIYMNWA